MSDLPFSLRENDMLNMEVALRVERPSSHMDMRSIYYFTLGMYILGAMNHGMIDE